MIGVLEAGDGGRGVRGSTFPRRSFGVGGKPPPQGRSKPRQPG